MPNAKKQCTTPRVLVTRPAHQAIAFCQLLQKAGFEPLQCPTVEIAPMSDQTLVTEQLSAMPQADVVLFTSANAVRFAEQVTPIKKNISQNAKILAVGPATLAALEQCGLRAQMPAFDFSSDGLLAMPALSAVKGRTVLLVKGLGGLRKLPDTLRLRGANLLTAETYQRLLPASDSILKHLFHSELPQIISTTSNETLTNLVTMTPVEQRPQLKQLPVIVNSERGEQLAYSLGFCDEILRASPVGDDGQINTLKAWITQRLTQR